MPARVIARLLPLLVLVAGCSSFRDFRDRMSESARALVTRSYHDSEAEFLGYEIHSHPIADKESGLEKPVCPATRQG